MGLKFGYLWGMVLNWNIISLVGGKCSKHTQFRKFCITIGQLPRRLGKWCLE